ncbi:MAG: DUF3499 domain-containing protein [Candidatus Nanopelagicaceae bacterium]|jgi:hypothetical protein
MSIRTSRHCSRSGCHRKAAMTLTYVYSESIAVLGPLATYSEPHAYDLCEIHGAKLTAPNGWQVIRREINSGESGPSEEDLMAIANAVREAASREVIENSANISANTSAIGRRGHLRSVPNS